MGTTQGATTPPRGYRLFHADAVALAAFICSPLAGAILIAVNYVRLGNARKGAFAVLFGLIAGSIPVLITWNAHTLFGALSGLALGFLFFLCTWQIALEVQGEAIEEHVAAGGQLGTLSMALFVGIASFAGLLGLAYAVSFAVQPRKVMLGSNDKVIYSGLATKASALALGNQLKNHNYFTDRGATVLLNKDIASRTISFVLQDGLWNQAGILSSFEELARKAAPTVGGLPVDIQLLDGTGTEEAKSTVGAQCFSGNHCVFYEGTATEDEAQALGQQLDSGGFFRNNAADVLLIRHPGEGTTITFIVIANAWNDPQKVDEFGKAVRDASTALGGLPIVMHLVDTQLELKKDELIE